MVLGAAGQEDHPHPETSASVGATAVFLNPEPGDGGKRHEGKGVKIFARVDGKNEDPNTCEDRVGLIKEGDQIAACAVDGIGSGTDKPATVALAKALAKNISEDLLDPNAELIATADQFKQRIISALERTIAEVNGEHANVEKLGACITVLLVDLKKRISWILRVGDGFNGWMTPDGQIDPFFCRKALLPETKNVYELLQANRNVGQVIEEIIRKGKGSTLTDAICAGKRTDRNRLDILKPETLHIPEGGGTFFIGSDGIMSFALNLGENQEGGTEKVNWLHEEAHKAKLDDVASIAITVGPLSRMQKLTKFFSRILLGS
ncbi:protein phosphatase 2C domain-containing protein [Candidatus Peregrinibacteria bacterium]|nr:MAG: protein phosphatase 2C domain-containing protein [Candidatus Peregrinibacteria bacterium]